MSSQPADPHVPAIAFVLEQSLGHVTHSQNLQALVPGEARAADAVAEFLPIAFDPGRWGRVPGWSNWTVRAGVRARRALARLGRRPDALVVHTQVPAMLLGRWMRKVPTVVSLDATPAQIDHLGEFYRHTPGRPLAERLKRRVHLHALRRAGRLVTWSTWTRDDLVARYGIEPSRITVLPPGVDTGRWTVSEHHAGPLQVLFVGGDAHRKGGDLLVEAAGRLRGRSDVPEFEVHIVTASDIAAPPGIVVHHGLTPNSPGLIERFREADVFCLPTLGDCLPMVLAEAGACGLPLISTDVGAISEIVRPGETGELIAPGDVEALEQALARLLGDHERRRALGTNARALVEQRHDARTNAGELVRLARSLVKN